MKKTLLWIILLLSSSFVLAAYEPTNQDQGLLDNLEQKVSMLNDSNKQKLYVIEKKIDLILPQISSETRLYYILESLHTIIRQYTNEQNTQPETSMTYWFSAVGSTDTTIQLESEIFIFEWAEVNDYEITYSPFSIFTWPLEVIKVEVQEWVKNGEIFQLEIAGLQNSTTYHIQVKPKIPGIEFDHLENSEITYTTKEAINNEVIEEEDDNQEIIISTDPEIIDVEWRNYFYSQDLIVVEEGEEVIINFTSASGFHDLVIDEYGIATEKLRPEDGIETVSFIADKVGQFDYYCSVGDHRVQWMEGKLMVLSEEHRNKRAIVRIERERAYLDFSRWEIEESWLHFIYDEDDRHREAGIISKISERYRIEYDEVKEHVFFVY